MASSSIKAALTEKCPQCHQGDIFEHGMYDLNNGFLKMHKHCSHCGIKYEAETGFFWGAMYIAYAFVVGIFLVCLVGLFVFKSMYSISTGRSLLYFAPVYLGLVMLLWPPINRFARVAMLYLFSPYSYHPELEDAPAKPAQQQQ